MSLIEEALRRVKEPLLDAYPRASPSKDAAPAQPSVTARVAASPASRYVRSASPRRSVNPLRTLAFALLGLTVVLLLGGALWIARSLGERERLSDARALSTPTAPRARARAPRSARAFAPEPLVLSGVVEGPGESYAVINDRVLQLGEDLGPWTLWRIGEGSATLRRATGDEIVLRVRP